MSKTTWLILCTVLALAAWSTLAGAAQQSDQTGSMGKDTGKTITGCVQKGEEPGGYTLKTDDGTTYELMGNSVDLGNHVGHKVTLTGHKTHESKAEEAQKQTTEQKEAGGGSYADFRATNLTMVSGSCQ